MANAFTDLLQNNLFLQALAGTGSAISSNKPVGAELGRIVQENISAQSQDKLQQKYMKMLAGMLKGNVPVGGTVKKTAKGLTLDAPNPLAGDFEDESVGEPDLGPDATLSAPALSGNTGLPTESVSSVTQPVKPVLDSAVRGGVGGTPNPFSPSQLSTPADLAGLSPQNVALALQGATNVEQVRQISQTRQSNQALKWAEKIREWNATGPVELPGRGKITLDEWKTLDSKTKAYSYYAYDTKQRGEDILSYNEWDQQVDPTTIEQIFKLAEEDEDFKTFAFAYKKAGATKISLGEKLEEVTARAGLKGQLYFKDPKWIDDVSKHVNSEDVQNKLFQLEPADRAKAANREKISYIESKITAGGGKVIDVKVDRDTREITWTVKWKSGATETIKYGVSP